MQAQIDQLISEVTRAKFRERRTELRESFVRPVSIYPADRDVVTTFSKNISRQGIAIISRTLWDPGSVATIKIHSLDRAAMYFRCEARWSDPYCDDWFVSGWKFLAVTARPMI